MRKIYLTAALAAATLSTAAMAADWVGDYDAPTPKPAPTKRAGFLFGQ